MMVGIFSQQYLFFEKALFVFCSGVMLMIVMFGFQPITHIVIFGGFNSDFAYKLAIAVVVIG